MQLPFWWICTQDMNAIGLSLLWENVVTVGCYPLVSAVLGLAFQGHCRHQLPCKVLELPAPTCLTNLIPKCSASTASSSGLPQLSPSHGLCFFCPLLADPHTQLAPFCYPNLSSNITSSQRVSLIALFKMCEMGEGEWKIQASSYVVNKSQG